MLTFNRTFFALTMIFVVGLSVSACHATGTKASKRSDSSSTFAKYSWTRVTEKAAFPGAYNFPVFNAHNQMWAFHPQGNWYSTDGRTWTKSELSISGLNSGFQKLVLFNDAVYALGTMEGNINDLRLHSRIARTSDFKRWEVLAETSDLPLRVFYGAVVFNKKIWLMGGYDGANYYNDIWNSSDGVHWTKVVANAPWSKRNVGAVAVFKDRVWIIGGGVINGTTAGKGPESEVWSSDDGIKWTLATDQMPHVWGTTPVVYDGKLWLVGANRDGNFTRAVLSTEDGINWNEETAPWSPRGAAATWVWDNKLYMTGGKYSTTENGEIKFIYSNDVWCLSKTQS